MVLHQPNTHVISDDNYFYDTVSQTIQMAERHVRDAVTNQVPTTRSLKKLTKTTQTQVNIAT